MKKTTTIRKQFDPGNTLDLGVTVDEAVSFIVDTLKDPLRPHWCGPCVVGCFLVIRLDHNNVETLINRNHLFCSSLVAFLTVQRTPADHEALDDSGWSTCRCPLPNIAASDIARRIHTLALGMGPVFTRINADPANNGRAIGRFGDRVDILSIVIDGLVRFLMDASSKLKPFSVAKGRHPDIWPATSKDFIPYGPETTVESLVTLSRFMRSAQAFSLLRLFVGICGPLIIPAIVSSRPAAKYLVEHGLRICADVTSMERNGQLTEIAAGNFSKELQFLAFFISGLRTIPPLLNRDFQFGHAKDTFSFLTQAITIMESHTFSDMTDLQKSRKILTSYAAVLYTTMPEQMNVPKSHVHPEIFSAINCIFETRPAAVVAWDMIRHAKTIQFCFAPGCKESAQTSVVYRRCSGCCIVAYSSKECQKRAWTDKRLPHKSICKKMKQVFDAGGSHLHRKQDQDKFVQDMQMGNVPESTLKEVGNWLCIAYMMLQRKGPLLTADVRQHLSERGGPIYPEGVDEFMSERVESFMQQARPH